MIPAAQVNVEINQEEIKNYIQQQLDGHLRREILFIDVNGLVEITSCSKKWLETELLNDPRIRVHERRKNRKRLWVYKDVVEAIMQIADEEW